MQGPSQLILTRIASTPAPEEEVLSPCRNLCELDITRRHCVGCGRTIEEISRWSAMTVQERKNVLARLKHFQ